MPRLPRPTQLRVLVASLALAALPVLFATGIGGTARPAVAAPAVAAASVAPAVASARRVVSGTWRRGVTTRLAGDVHVAPGYTLRIEPGARIEAQPGARLVIERGATLIAEGTALEPITFTCRDASPIAGCWDGIVLQGAAPVNAGAATSPPAPRTGDAGCPELPSDAGGMFGGCDADDVSGRLSYVRIEYARTGLQLEGVGRGTSIADVEVRRSTDDGIAVLGGTVDLRRVFASANGRHGLWWTRGWSGRVQQLIVQMHPAGFTAAISGENGPGVADAGRAPRSAPTIFNTTIVAASWPTANPQHATAAAVRLVRGSGLQLANALLLEAPIGLDIDDAATCQALGAEAFRRIVTARAASAGDPDVDASPCGAEAARLTDVAAGNVVLATDSLVVRAPLDLVTPDLRPGASGVWQSLQGIAPPTDGFFAAGLPYLGAVPPSTQPGTVPWYASWIGAMPSAGVPVLTVALSPATQGGTAGLAVAAPPRVRAVDASGGGVPGLQVVFTVRAGDGAVAVTTTRTDADGVATAGTWTLGAEVGEQLVTAEFDGLPSVTFRATATAPAGQGWLERVAGTQDQVAAAGSAVPVRPAVIVRSPTGATVAGAAVTFSVLQGGGSVTGATAVSDASGVARVGSWTLGPSGEQRLRATLAGSVGTSFRASLTAAAAPAIDGEVWIPLEQLDRPWDLAFAPDGTALLTERAGRIRIRRPGTTTLGLLATVPDVVDDGQGGLLGIAFDPDFASNRYVYAYASLADGAGGTSNRVIRWRVASDWSALLERTDLVSGIAWGLSHVGGRIRFGLDGMLYVPTGDTRVGGVPQDLTSLGGKVLRVTRNGAAAPGNPAWTGGGDARIYVYGIRNVQGLAMRRTGEVFSCEHGPVAADEVTRLQAGGNGGWDPRLAGDDYFEYRGYEGAWPMTDTVRYPAALRPTWTTGAQSEGMSPCTFLAGSAWGAWDGALVVGLMSGFRAAVLELSSDGRSVTREWPLPIGTARARSVVQGPDGSLYVITDFQGVYRLTPR